MTITTNAQNFTSLYPVSNKDMSNDKITASLEDQELPLGVSLLIELLNVLSIFSKAELLPY